MYRPPLARHEAYVHHYAAPSSQAESDSEQETSTSPSQQPLPPSSPEASAGDPNSESTIHPPPHDANNAFLPKTETFQSTTVAVVGSLGRSPTKITIGEAVKKNLGLTILNTLHFKRSKPSKRKQSEQPKIAVQKSRLIALSGLLIHVVPVFACIVLLWFNFRGFYIGGELAGFINQDSTKVNALQFAAKLHEITMMSSLTVIIFTLLRRKVVAGTVPLGALITGFEFANVQYLWSRELWGAFRPMVKDMGWLFVIILLFATVLVPLLGPASALLMIPRLADWPVGGADFHLNASSEDIWPTHVKASSVDETCRRFAEYGASDRSCPGGGWEALKSAPAIYATNQDTPWNSFAGDIGPYPIAGKYGLTTMTMSGWNSVAQLCISDVLIHGAQIWSSNSGHGKESSGSFYKWRRSTTFSVKGDILQPFTGIFCDAQEKTISNNDNQATLTLTSPVDVVNSFPTNVTFMDQELNSTRPSLRFMDTVEGLQGSVVAIMTLPGPQSPGNVQDVDPDQGRDAVIMGCTIHSRWIESKPYITNDGRVQRTWTVDNLFDYPQYAAKLPDKDSPLIKIDSAWADYLNPTLNDNSTVFEELVYAIQPPGTLYDWLNWDDLQKMLPAIVNNGLARISYHATIQGSLPDSSKPRWFMPMFPKKAFGPPSGQIWNTEDIDTSNMFKASFTATINGYGYWTESKTVLTGVIVLLFYCCFAIPYTVFALVSGVNYLRWDSIMELTTLAIQSERTDKLKNTTAGIAGSSVYSIPVQLRAVDDHIEILFNDDRESEPIERNKLYS